MADAAHKLVPLFITVLVAFSAPNVAASHTVSREFLVGGAAAGVAFPVGTADDERCDFECVFTVGSVDYLFLSVQGSEGRDFPYQWQTTGCPTAQPFRPGYGERFVWMGGCTGITVRPQVAEAFLGPWGCTYQPFTGKTMVPVPAPFGPFGFPVSNDPADYTSIAACAPSCAIVDVPQPCLPFPTTGIGGTVTLRW